MDIFLLEDDDAIAMGLTYSLEPEGYQVTRASTVKEAMRLMAERPFSLYILDLTLPDGSGYDVCRKIKEKGDFPVIILTVMEEEVNVVMGLELGADDYITKPFRVRELLARKKRQMECCGTRNFAFIPMRDEWKKMEMKLNLRRWNTACF